MFKKKIALFILILIMISNYSTSSAMRKEYYAFYIPLMRLGVPSEITQIILNFDNYFLERFLDRTLGLENIDTFLRTTNTYDFSLPPFSMNPLPLIPRFIGNTLEIMEELTNPPNT